MFITKLKTIKLNKKDFFINNNFIELKHISNFKELTTNPTLKSSNFELEYIKNIQYTISNLNVKPLTTYILNIHVSNSNIILSVTDKNGNLISYYTAGKLGFKGSQKTKKYTLITILKNFIYNLNYLNNTTVIVKFKGITRNQNLIVKKLKEKLFIKAIIYNNLLPHNGCRPKKIRRK